MDAVAELLEWRREHGVYTAPADRDYSPPEPTHGAIANSEALTGRSIWIEPVEEDSEIRAERHRAAAQAMQEWLQEARKRSDHARREQGVVRLREHIRRRREAQDAARAQALIERQLAERNQARVTAMHQAAATAAKAERAEVAKFWSHHRYGAGPLVGGGYPIATATIQYVGPLAMWIGAVVTWNYQQNIITAPNVTLTLPLETVNYLTTNFSGDWQLPGHSPRTIADTSLSSDAISTGRILGRSVSDSSASSDTTTAVLMTSGPHRPIADTSASSDAATRSAMHFTRSVSDTSASSDSVSSALAASTLIAQVALAAGSTPSSRTNHFLWIRGRTQTAVQVTFRMLLFQGSTQITSAILETTALTTSIVSYSLSILSGDASNITDYTALSAQFWAYSSTVAHPVVEVEEVWLQIPHT